MAASNTNGESPRNKDFTVNAGPRTERFKDSAQRCYDLWVDAKQCDPAANKREAILRAYYNHPYKMSPAMKAESVLTNPSRTSFGILPFKVNQAKSSYMDMLNEREAQMTVTSEANLTKDPERSKVTRAMWSTHVTWAFERYFYKEWEEHSVNEELGVQDMLLYGKGITHWPTPFGARSRNVPVEKLYPNQEAGMLPSGWDHVHMETDPYWTDLWEMVKNPKTAKDAGWDREAIVKLMRASEPEWSNESDVQLIKRIEDGSIDKGTENKRCYLVEFYVKEYEPNSKGFQISKYIIPQNIAVARPDDTTQEDGSWYYVFRKPFYAKKMDNLFAVTVDNVGHGKYYQTPSFAESIFVACRTYDQKMNRVIDATELNSMLMTTGGDANAGKNLAKYRIHDRIHFPPGTNLTQTRFQLPVTDSLEVLNRVMVDMSRGIGSYELQQVNASGGKTPATATQVQLDSAQSAKIEGSAMKRFNRQQTAKGREEYRRFTTELTPKDPEWDGFQRFKTYLRSQGVPAHAWKPENVLVESNMNLGAGSAQMKMQTTKAVVELLNIVPRSEGQKVAIREGVGSLKGAGSIDRYFPPEDELRMPTTEDWRIGQENEAMKDTSVKMYNLFVIESDDHIRHLFGSGKKGQPPIGHLEDAAISISEGLQMIQGFETAPATDQPLLADKVAEVIAEATAKSGHSKGHLAHLAQDPSKKQQAQQGQAMIAGIDRGINQLANQLQEAQDARMRRLQQGMEEEGNQAEQAKIALRHAEAQAEQQRKDDAHQQKMRQAQQMHDSKLTQSREKLAQEVVDAQEKSRATARDGAIKTAGELERLKVKKEQTKQAKERKTDDN